MYTQQDFSTTQHSTHFLGKLSGISALLRPHNSTISVISALLRFQLYTKKVPKNKYFNHTKKYAYRALKKCIVIAGYWIWMYKYFTRIVWAFNKNQFILFLWNGFFGKYAQTEVSHFILSVLESSINSDASDIK